MMMKMQLHKIQIVYFKSNILQTYTVFLSFP